MPRPPLPSNIICYHCGSLQTSKAGFTRGKQRYYCRSCRRWSRDNPCLSGDIKKKRRLAQLLPSESRMILELRAIAQRTGKTPTTTDIVELSKKGKANSLNSYYQVFGSFTEAIRKARLNPQYNQVFDKDRLIEELCALRNKLKRPLFGKDVVAARQKGKVSSIYHFQRAFGSVPKAIKAANAGNKTYSRAEIIEVLRQIDRKLDRPVLASDVDILFRAYAGPSVQAIEREFGGMAKARHAAGVKNVFYKAGHSVLDWQKYTAAELKVQLKSLGEKLGRKPTDRDINRASQKGLCASAGTFGRIFGSLVEAYRQAGFGKVKPHFYKEEEILSAIITLAKEKRRRLTHYDLVAARKAGKIPSLGTIRRRIGLLEELNSGLESLISLD